MNKHDSVLNNWIRLWVLDTWVVLDKDSFNLYANLEGGMVLLFIPQIDALQDCLCNLSFDMIK